MKDTQCAVWRTKYESGGVVCVRVEISLDIDAVDNIGSCRAHNDSFSSCLKANRFVSCHPDSHKKLHQTGSVV